MKRFALQLLFPALLLFSHTLFAAGQAVLKSGKGADAVQMVLEYDGIDKVRMNVPKQPQGGDNYMLLKDGKVWMVMNMQGQVMVMDMARMASMAQGGASGDDAIKQELISAKKTGRKAKVAGYDGEVYEMTWRDRQGVHTADVVLSDDRDVVEYSRAWMNFAQSMAGSMGRKNRSENSIGHYLDNEGKGLLKMGDQFEVVSIKSGSVSDSRFVLPKATMQMPFMPR
ncbi:DUF4412 domain-containing protein [Thiolapillus sp.]